MIAPISWGQKSLGLADSSPIFSANFWTPHPSYMLYKAKTTAIWLLMMVVVKYRADDEWSLIIKKGYLILAESPYLGEFHAPHAWVKDNVHIESNIAILGSYGDIVVLVSSYLRICHCRHNMSERAQLSPHRPPTGVRWEGPQPVDSGQHAGLAGGERDRNMRTGCDYYHGSLGVSPHQGCWQPRRQGVSHCIASHPALAHVLSHFC